MSNKLEEKFKRVTSNSLRYLNSITEDHIGDFDYIPESVQPYINNFVREGRQNFDMLSGALEGFDKSSDEHIAIQKEIENVARTFINVRGQIDKYKKGIGEFRNIVPQVNKGTQDSHYYVNSAVFGNQWDDMNVDKDGNFQFKITHDENEGGIFNLDDLAPIENGSAPIITEPWANKTYVFKLAERTKAEKDMGKPFDYNSTYNNALSSFTDSGANGIIGLAFTDMAGDGRTKSFAEMYEEGLNDQSLYTHPETGQTLPKDITWMKDANNASVLSQVLSKYITNVMKDIHRPAAESFDKVTNKLAQNKLANELIKKYSK